MKRFTIPRLVVAAATGFGLAALPAPALAFDFALSASPPRFEFAAKPGETTRNVIELDNAALAPARYTIKTADWTLDRNFGAVFSDALAPGGCRPWVSIERHDIVVPARGHYRYRFEVTPPVGAARGECRFAVLIEGEQQNVTNKSGLTVPVSGRLGVIVYVAIGDVRADLQPVGYAVEKVNGEPTPVIQVRNTGDAHGRLAGFLSGVDARGANIEFSPSSLPVLPGETRSIPLVIDQPDNAPPIHIAYPITIHGKVRWADKPVAFSQVFAP